MPLSGTGNIEHAWLNRQAYASRMHDFLAHSGTVRVAAIRPKRIAATPVTGDMTL